MVKSNLIVAVLFLLFEISSGIALPPDVNLGHLCHLLGWTLYMPLCQPKVINSSYLFTVGNQYDLTSFVSGLLS